MSVHARCTVESVGVSTCYVISSELICLAWLVSQLFKSLVLSLSPQLPWLRRKTTSGQHGAALLVFFYVRYKFGLLKK